MSDAKITVGGQMEEQAARRFVDAWHRAEQGQSFRLRHLAFASWDALARVLTGKRMALLRYVRHHTVSRVRAWAKALRARLQPRACRRAGADRGGPAGGRGLMECLSCKGRLLKSSAPFSIDRGGYHLHWDVVPAWVCSQCGLSGYVPDKDIAIEFTGIRPGEKLFEE